MVFTLCLQPRRGSEPLRWNVKQEQDQKDIVNNLNFLSSAMSGMCVGTFSSDSVTLVFNYLQRPEEGSSSRSSLGISTSFITGTAGFTSRIPHLASHLEPLSRSPPAFPSRGRNALGGSLGRGRRSVSLMLESSKGWYWYRRATAFWTQSAIKYFWHLWFDEPLRSNNLWFLKSIVTKIRARQESNLQSSDP